MLFDKPFDFDRFVRLLIGLALIVGVYWLLDTLSAVLLPFFLAWLTAYVLEPAVRMVQRLVKKRVVSVILTITSLSAFATILLVLLIPVIIDEVLVLERLVSDKASSMSWPDWLPDHLFEDFRAYLGSLDVQELVKQTDIQDRAAGVFSSIMDVLGQVFGALGALFGAFTYLLYLIFIMIDYERLNSNWRKLVPEKYKSFINRLVDDLEDGMNGYFKAQAKIVLVVTVVFAIGFKLVGLPFGIMLGLFAGLLNFIPYAQLFSIPPAILLTALHSLESDTSFWWLLLMVLTVYAVAQVLQDLYLTPKFMGDFSGFNPAIILLSLSIWGTLLGMLGLIIAIPLTSLLIHYYKRFIIDRNTSV